MSDELPNNTRLHYANKKHAKLADWLRRKAAARDETDQATSTRAFNRAVAKKKNLDAEKRQLDAEAETFDCDDCGKERPWGEHWLLSVRNATPPRKNGIYPPAIQLSHDVEIPICARCAKKNPIIKLFQELQAKLTTPSEG